MTLGFRGEALASICAVSKVDVLTKRPEEDYGTHYVIEGAVEKTCEECGCPDGTTFVVRDIFYNVPARLKFLKKDVSEGNFAADLVTKLTLSHPEISFKFIRDNKVEILTAGDGKIYSAVYSVYGRDFANSMLEVDYTWQGMHITGFTVKPLSAKPNRRFQNFFVNKRYVKSRACAAALEEAYRNLLMTGKFPACVLYIDIPPNTIDVNVHPTKIEVRFSDEKLMHEAVFFAVKNSLMKNDRPNEMHLENKRNFTDRELFDIPKRITASSLNSLWRIIVKSLLPQRLIYLPQSRRQRNSTIIRTAIKSLHQRLKQSRAGALRLRRKKSSAAVTICFLQALNSLQREKQPLQPFQAPSRSPIR